MKTKRDFATVNITCELNLSTNERTITIEITKIGRTRPFLVVSMTPKDFAETLCSHIGRPAIVEPVNDE